MSIKVAIFFTSLFLTSAQNTTNSGARNPRVVITPLISRLTFPWVPTLLLPQSATQRLQLIWGVGIPLQREVESLIWGMVIKAAYFMTGTLNDLKPKPLAGLVKGERKRRKVETYEADVQVLEEESMDNPKGDTGQNPPKSEGGEFTRWHLYRVLEHQVSAANLGGRECVLKAICEAAETHFSKYSGLLGEMIHIMLTPSTTQDRLLEHSDNEYLYAEKAGREGAQCDRVFSECSVSLLELFSGISDPLASDGAEQFV